MRAVVFLTASILLVSSCDTSRNTPDPADKFFLRYYGAQGDQEAVDMVANPDGTFVLLGTSHRTINESEVYLVKVNANGIVLWEEFYLTGISETAKDIEPATDGNYVILSDKTDASTGTDFFLRIVDADGVEVSTGEFNVSGNSNEVAVSVTQITDVGVPAGFIVTGSTNASNFGNVVFQNTTAVFARFNQDGTPYQGVWNNFAGAEGDDYGVRVVQRKQDLTQPDPFAFFGYTNSISYSDVSNPSFNYWMSYLNDGGGGSGTRTVDASPTANERLSMVAAINPTNSPMYILSGIVSSGGNDKIFIAGVDDVALSPGILAQALLSADLGDLGVEGTSFQNVSVCALARPGYLVSANMLKNGNSDVLLMKLRNDGTEVWSEPVLLGGGGNDKQAAVSELADGRFLILGTFEVGDNRQQKMALMKVNPKGQLRN